MNGWPRRLKRRKRLRLAILGLLVAVFLLPLLWSILASIGMQPDNLTSPPKWSLPPSFAAYEELGVKEPQFWRNLVTSMGVSAAATVLAIAISFAASHAVLGARRGRRDRLLQGFLVLACLPVMAYLLPLKDTFRILHLYDTFAGLLLAQTAVFSPFAVYILSGFLRQVSSELEESARLDGASPARILLGILLPACAPGVAATAIVLFVLNWNSFLLPLVLAARIRPLPVAMSSYLTFERDLEWPVAAAAITLSLIPLCLLVAAGHRLLQRFFLGLPTEAQ